MAIFLMVAGLKNTSYSPRDSSYRLIIPFESFGFELVSIEKTPIGIFDFFTWLCSVTGSQGLPFQSNELVVSPRA